MRNGVLFIVLLSFLYQETSSFWVVTSFYINQEFIANNLCINRFEAVPTCNGKCVLANELSVEAEKEQQIPNIKNKEIQPLFHIVRNLKEYIISTQYHAQPEYPEYKPNLNLSQLVFPVFQPPELI